MNKPSHSKLLSTALLARAASIAALCLLAACGGGSGETAATSNTSPPAVQPPLASNSTISGKVVAPDGITPISNALVYIENSSVSKKLGAAFKAATLACGEVPDETWLAACSGSDGVFSLSGNVSNGSKLVAVKGAFRLETTLTVNGSQVQLGPVAFSSANSAKIAVVTGVFDRIEDVLAKLGFGELESGKLKLGTEKFALYSGDSSLPANYKGASALFLDADNNGKLDIFDYSIVFLNCGLDESLWLTATNLVILRQYVEAGGRLYVSDLAYDVVEQAFPGYVDFYGSDSTPASAPEGINSAEVGQSDITVTATLDPALKSWMQGVSCQGGSCLLADGTALIDGFLSGWGVINGPHANADVKTWASGAVIYEGVTQATTKPLSISFKAGAGRVTYTSYHNEANIGALLLPQQRILQYLVFEL